MSNKYESAPIITPKPQFCYKLTHITKTPARSAEYLTILIYCVVSFVVLLPTTFDYVTLLSNMQNIFGEKIKNLRKDKFPGLSLRKVGDLLYKEHDFPRFFYTQLNKIELGFVLPSSELLAKLLNAYKASDKERLELVRTYATQMSEERVRMVAEDTNVDYAEVGEIVLNRERKIDT